MYAVIYFSRSGNTKKLAKAISKVLGVKAQHIMSVESIPERADIFLGSGLYFMRPSKLIREFIRNNDFQGRNVAIFGTSSAGIGIETMGIEWLLRRKGANIIGRYHCPGQFFFRIVGKSLYFRKGRPLDEDLEKAMEFADLIRNNLYDINIVLKSQEV